MKHPDPSRNNHAVDDPVSTHDGKIGGRPELTHFGTEMQSASQTGANQSTDSVGNRRYHGSTQSQTRGSSTRASLSFKSPLMSQFN